MLDHAGFPVSDYARSKAFYLQALAPLGYALVMEVQQNENDSPAAGFGVNGKPDFWIGGEGGLQRPIHIAIAARDRAAVDAFYRAAIAAGGKDNGAPGLRPHFIRTTTQLSCSIRMATISRPCVTRRRDRPAQRSPCQVSRDQRDSLSWPDLFRPSTSLFDESIKTWMPRRAPA
jgi:hypothetical protein